METFTDRSNRRKGTKLKYEKVYSLIQGQAIRVDWENGYSVEILKQFWIAFTAGRLIT